MPKNLDIKGNPRKNKGAKASAKYEVSVIPKAMQPNYVTYMRADYTLQQYRVFLIILYELRAYMERIQSGETSDDKQLALFDEFENYQMVLPLSKFGVQASNFPLLKKNIVEMMRSVIEMPTHIAGEKGIYTKVTTLFSSIDIPTEKYQTNVYFRFNPQTINFLIDTKSLGFTKYYLDIALAVKRVSTIRMYMLISSWKDKGGFEISNEELRSILLGPGSKKYPTVKSFYDNVIKKAYDDLFQRADVYFEIDIKPRKNDEKKWRIKVITADQVLSDEDKTKFEKERDLVGLLIEYVLKSLSTTYGVQYYLTTKELSSIKLLCRYDTVYFIIQYIKKDLLNEIRLFIDTSIENGTPPQAPDVTRFLYRRIKHFTLQFQPKDKKAGEAKL